MLHVTPARAATIATLAALALFAAAVALPGTARKAGAGPVTHVLSVTDDKFCDQGGTGCATVKVITINAGDTVDWQWLGTTGHDHTVTSCSGSHSFPNCDGALFDSFPPKDSGSFQFTFPANGTFNYWCGVHDFNMRGTIQVGPTPTPSPSPTMGPTASPTLVPTGSPTVSATATATATATPTPTASATLMGTPTGSAAATATPSATVTATATAPASASATNVTATMSVAVTANPSPSADPGRSDVTCDGATDDDDVLALLLHAANGGTSSPAGTDCPPPGSDEGGALKGDLNCDGAVDGSDALVALYVWAGLPLPAGTAACLVP
jgi:plastocyanin